MKLRRKCRTRSVLDALKARVAGDPDAFVDVPTATTDGAIVAARLLEKSGGLRLATVGDTRRSRPLTPKSFCKQAVDVAHGATLTPSFD